jgi:membrane protein YdbS with pleckstrin-like domain
MEPIAMKPEKELKTLWFTCWSIWFVIDIVAWLLLMLVQPIVFGLLLVGSVIVAVLILVWIPAFYTNLEYVINNDCIKGKSGVFWKKYITIPFTKVTNLDITQGPLQRIFDIGTIHIQTAGASGQQTAKAELSLLGVRNLEEIKESIMAKIRAYTLSGLTQPRQPITDQDKTQVFDRILDELVAIRKALESKNY